MDELAVSHRFVSGRVDLHSGRRSVRGSGGTERPILDMQRESADFINGNRFARPMELGAMRLFNWLGKEGFARLMIFLLG